MLARRALRRDWEAFRFLAIGYLLLASLQLFGDMRQSQSQYPIVRKLVDLMDLLRTAVLPVLHPLPLIAAACNISLPLPVKSRRAIIDIFALWYIPRIIDLFFLINLLIFLRMPDHHALLILQLLAFLTSHLLMWGWIYRRVDIGKQIASGKAIFDFKLTDSISPTIYDAFLASFTSLISSTLNGFSDKMRTARALVFIHGLMMWNVMGLMLSRAIALIST